MADSEILRHRRLESTDYDEVNTLYNIVFNRTRTRAIFDWEFLNNPYGKSLAFIAERKTDSKIIAFNGIIPYQLKNMGTGEILRTGKLENTMMHPDYRGKGYYKKLERAAEEEYLKNGFTAIWSSAQHTRKLRESISGFSHLFAARNLIIVNRQLIYPGCWPFPALKAFTPKVAAATMAIQKRKKTASDLTYTISEMPPEFDIEQFHADDIIPDQFNKFARWRFSKNPYLNSYFLNLWRKQEPFGTVVLTPVKIRMKRFEFSVAFISDFHLTPGMTGKHTSVILNLIRTHSRVPFIIFWYNPCNSRMNEFINLFRRNATFSFRLDEEVPLMVKASEDTDLSGLKTRLWFTPAFTEGRWA